MHGAKLSTDHRGSTFPKTPGTTLRRALPVAACNGSATDGKLDSGQNETTDASFASPMRRWLIEKFLRRRGLTVVSADGPNFEAALQRLAKREIVIQTVIDVGASDGAWSRQVLKVFPKVRVLCIEAQQAHEPALREFMAGNSRAGYVLAAAGPRIGQISFDDTALFGGSAAEYAPEGKVTQVAMTTIDHEIAKRSLPGPYLIKLDTHGFELEILDGAKQALEQTNAVVIEVYNFD